MLYISPICVTLISETLKLLGGLAPRLTVSFEEHSGVPSVSFGVERRTATEEEKRRALESVIDRLQSIQRTTDRPVAVVLDEFQAIRDLSGESGEWYLRDLIQQHGDLSFICAGSQESLIESMIGPKRAFYKMFEVLHIGPLDEDHFSNWIAGRLRLGLDVEGDVGLETVRQAGPRTQDVVQVARQLYFRGLTLERPVRPADVSDALEEVVQNEDPLFDDLYISARACCLTKRCYRLAFWPHAHCHAPARGLVLRPGQENLDDPMRSPYSGDGAFIEPL